MPLVELVLVLTLLILLAIKYNCMLKLKCLALVELVVLGYAALWSFIAWLLHWGSDR